MLIEAPYVLVQDAPVVMVQVEGCHLQIQW